MKYLKLKKKKKVHFYILLLLYVHSLTGNKSDTLPQYPTLT